MDEFIARGFAATRLDDVARHAGVAKGTIYLHFSDKEALFQELIRTALVPLIGRLAAPPPPGDRSATALEAFARPSSQEVVGDEARRHRALDRRRGAAVSRHRRLLLPRGGFARHGRHAGLIELGVARGEIRQQGPARFPQIVVAPAIVAVIWQSLFNRHAPLDATEMLRVHLDLIFGERRTP